MKSEEQRLFNLCHEAVNQHNYAALEKALTQHTAFIKSNVASRQRGRQEVSIDRQVELIKARLVTARERAGLTQAQAAKLLGFNAGSNIAQYEGERSIPNLRLFLHMCEVYNVSPAWALTGINPDFNPMPIIEAFGNLTDDAIKVIELLESLQQPAGEQ